MIVAVPATSLNPPQPLGTTTSATDTDPGVISIAFLIALKLALPAVPI